MATKQSPPKQRTTHDFLSASVLRRIALTLDLYESIHPDKKEQLAENCWHRHTANQLRLLAESKERT